MTTAIGRFRLRHSRGVGHTTKLTGDTVPEYSESSPRRNPGLPNFTIVGLTDRAIQEARERVRAAIRNAGFDFPMRRLTVNLAPAEIPKEGTGSCRTSLGRTGQGNRD
jgi:Subunit ChlI of Mg-chelatase